MQKPAVLAFLALMAACGSSQDDQLAPDFKGVYTSTSEGALHVMAFSTDHHYLLMPTGCAAQSCTELGTWSYDAAGHALQLTEATSNTTRTLRVDVVATTSPSGGLVTTKDDLTDPSQVLSGSGSQLNNGSSSQLNNGNGSQLNSGNGSQLNSGNGSQLNNGQSALADSASQLLQAIAKAMVNQQGMQQQGGGAAGGGGDQGGGAAAPAQDNNDDNAKPAVKAACQVGIPTPDTPADDVKAYWAQCPDGPLTPP